MNGLLVMCVIFVLVGAVHGRKSIWMKTASMASTMPSIRNISQYIYSNANGDPNNNIDSRNVDNNLKSSGDNSNPGDSSNEGNSSDRSDEIGNRDNTDDSGMLSTSRSLAGLEESECDVILSFNSHMDALVDKWFQSFVAKCSALSPKKAEVLRQQVLRNCEQEMNNVSAYMRNKDLTFKAALAELNRDMLDFINQLSDEVNSNSYIYSDDAYTSGVKRIPVWRQSIWIKRTKWAAAQALMIGLNFAQYELYRRMMKRAAERRLAEVPEFPLL